MDFHEKDEADGNGMSFFCLKIYTNMTTSGRVVKKTADFIELQFFRGKA